MAVLQGGAVIDKITVIKDKHGAGLYDCHQQQQQQRRPVFKQAFRYKPDNL